MTDIHQSRDGGLSPSLTDELSQSSQSPLSPAENSEPGSLREKAMEDIQQIRDFAQDQARQTVDRATEFASEEKNFVARQLDGIAGALERVGTELENTDQRVIGRYTKNIGSSAKKLAGDLQDRNISEIVAMAEDFGRRQPVAFLGLAALAGLAASRFVTASAEHLPSRAEQNRSERVSNSAAALMAGAGESEGHPNV